MALIRQGCDCSGDSCAEESDASYGASYASLWPEREELTGNDACGDDIECKPDDNGDRALPEGDATEQEFREEVEIAKTLMHGVDEITGFPEITEGGDEDEEQAQRGALRWNQAKTNEGQCAHEEVGEGAGGINPTGADATAKEGGSEEDDSAVQEKANASVTESFMIEGDHAHGHDGNGGDGEESVFVFGRFHL